MSFKCTLSIHLLILLYFIHQIGALMPINVNFNINFARSCDRSSSFFTRKLGISLTECVSECNIRTKCKAINFYRHRQICELLDKEQYSIKRMASCVYIRKADIFNARPCNCSQNKVCVTKGTEYTCSIKECEYLQVQNGVVQGNTNEIGSVQQVSCRHGYVPVGRTDNITCMESGFWNIEPVCLYGRQIGEHCSVSKQPCGNTKAQCIYSKCFCDPMYTYDEVAKDCVQRCTVLHDSFDKHPGVYFLGYNDKIKKMDTPEECKKQCIADPSCFHFEDWIARCNFGNVTYEMMEQADPDNIRHGSRPFMYSRTCS